MMPVELPAFVLVDVDSTLASDVLVAGVGGKRIELVQVMLVATGVGDELLRGVVRAAWVYGEGGGQIDLAMGAISPERPADYPPLPCELPLPIGQSLRFTAQAASAGLGRTEVAIGAMYRLV